MKVYSPEFLHFLKTITTEPYVVLDTETTALDQGEIVQIAITDEVGTPLLNRYVRPKNPIPPDATRIHGITNEMVASADTWKEVRYDVISNIAERTVIIYNAVYDRKMMHQSDDAWNLPRVEYKLLANFGCAMLAYAEFRGDWNSYHNSYRWQRLSEAAQQLHIPVANAHDALGDCLMTAAILQVMKFQARTSIRHPDNHPDIELGGTIEVE